MIANFLRKNPLKSWLLLFLGLGFFWFYVMMNPWLGFVNSDDAVPFQLVLEPWLPQDLFYWQTARMGMLFEIVWKAVLSLLGIRESIVGSMLHPELFYLCHVLIVFVGFAFWWETLRKWTSRMIFLVFFVPLTHTLIGFLAMPGQPYGVVFTLNGVFFWVLLQMSESAWKQGWLGLLLSAMIVQHELAGLILIAVYISRYFHHLRDPFRRQYLPMWLTWWSTFAVSCYFRSRSHEWDPHDFHYRLVSVTEWMTFVWESIRDGAWSLGFWRGTGHVITVAVVVYLCDLLRTQQQKWFTRDVEQTTFLAVIAGFLLIHLNRWYIINHKDHRYMINLIPLLIWVFLRKLESLPKEWNIRSWRKVIYLVACVAPLYTVQALSEWINPIARAQATLAPEATSDFSKFSVKECQTGDSAEACPLRIRDRILTLSNAVLEAGCASYTDDYWNSHILVVGSAGRIMTSANTHIRNPILFHRVLAARPLCVMPREGTPFQTHTSPLDCKNTPRGFLICKDKAQ